MERQKLTGKSAIARTVFIWIVLFLCIAGAFVIKKDAILDTLKTTGFFEKIGAKEPKFVAERSLPQPSARTPPAPPASPAPLFTPPAPAPAAADAFGLLPAPDAEAALPPPEAGGALPPAASGAEAAPEAFPPESAPLPPAPLPEADAALDITLCFVQIQTEGTITRKAVTRALPRTAAPLAAALQALLAGPAPAERSAGCMTLIPEHTRLISASLSGRTAVLNFSDEFQYNKYGVEGYNGSLMQIVYTAAQFPTVDGVQFLIEGERMDYIGSEGVWIGSPRTVESFR